MSSLFRAIGMKSLYEVKRLVENGANIHQKNVKEETPFLFAIQKEQLEIAKYLLERGADINAQNRLGWTALMYAANANKVKILRFLLENGANVEMKTKSGNTALMLACYKGKCEAVRLLLDASARVNLTNKNGNTPIQLAHLAGYRTIVSLLMEKGAVLGKPLHFRLSKEAKEQIEKRRSDNLNIGTRNELDAGFGKFFLGDDDEYDKSFYCGNLWRDVDFSKDFIVLALNTEDSEGEELVQFCENNKWGFREFRIEGEKVKRLFHLLKEAVTDNSKENLDHLYNYMQSLKP